MRVMVMVIWRVQIVMGQVKLHIIGVKKSSNCYAKADTSREVSACFYWVTAIDKPDGGGILLDIRYLAGVPPQLPNVLRAGDDSEPVFFYDSVRVLLVIFR
jgi:hypothetical protein